MSKCGGYYKTNLRFSYQGPVRILEEELHEDRVESIQWCNTPNELRFISGSRDGTARIWTFAHQRWNTLVLNMKTDDNTDPRKKNTTKDKPAPTTTTSTSRSGRTTRTAPSNDASNAGEGSGSNNNTNDQVRITTGSPHAKWAF